MTEVEGLSARFLNALDVRLRGAYAARPRLAEELAQLCFPKTDLQVAPIDFVAFLAERVRVDVPLEVLEVHDLQLACACAHAVSGAASELIKRHQADLFGRLLPEVGDGALVDEALQVTFARLLVGSGDGPRIVEYAGRGPLRSWLLVVALRVAHELRRGAAHRGHIPLEDVLDLPVEQSDPDLARHQGRQALSRALRVAVAALEPRLKTVLRLKTFEGLNIDELGKIYGVHRATVARWIATACEALRAAVRAELTRTLTLGPDSLESLLRLADHRIEISLSDTRASDEAAPHPERRSRAPTP